MDDQQQVAAPRAVLAASHPGPVVAVTTLAALLAAAAGLSVDRLTLAVAAVLAGQLSIGWSNDLVDLARDRQTGRLDKPLATGAVDAGTVRACCAVAVVATVGLSLACGWLAGAAHLALVAAGWAYNLRLKSTWGSWAPYAVAFGVLPVFVWLAGEPAALPPWWVPVAGALLGVGAHLLNALPDLADDEATGVRGLPHRMGARGAAALAAALLVLASAVATVVAPAGRTPLTWAAFGVAVALGAVALSTRGRTPFLAAVAIALVDVAALAWVL